MPAKTNLNISPYYDDFDKNDNFYKILFKPGYPVQARELTGLQSILQNQIESFGSHIFKEGSMVIPGSVTYDNRLFSIKVNPFHLGIDITVYLDSLIGKKVKGENSQIVASIKSYSIPPNDGATDITLYIKYLNSGIFQNDSSTSQLEQFLDGEVLILEENVQYGNTTLNTGDTILTLVSTNATSVGSAVGLTDGVYFIRGTFVDVQKDLIILEPYSTLPTYRVGLTISEEIITSNDDTDLNDNARGFSNYAAPGADRLKISVKLSKKSINDFEDTNFVELVRVDSGEIKKLQNKSVYSEIQKYLAKRTYEESGNYAISPFNVEILECLNDEISSGGVYTETQKTEQGNTPSEDLMCVKVSPGTAYVKGFDITLDGSRIIDVKKPRDIRTVDDSLIPFEMGNLLRVNNVTGSPLISLNNSNTVQLFNKRRNTSTTNAGTGTQIGEARVYAYNVTDAAYTNATTSWDLYLFDVQTYTSIYTSRIVTAAEAPTTSFVRGVSSGATGYVANRVNPNTLNLTQTSGTFLDGEQIIFNENSNISASVLRSTAYTTNDIKSVYQDSTALDSRLKRDFIADTVLYRSLPRGFSLTDRISVTTGGSVTCPGKSFVGIKTDSIIRYQKAGASAETFNRVSAISADGFTMTVTALDSSVTGVCDGTLPSSSTETTTFSVAVPQIANVNNASLYTPLPEKNIASINLSGANLVVTKQIYELSTNSSGELTSPITLADVGITSAFFEPFDAEKYSIHYSDGSTEPLTSDQFILGANGSSINFTGLTASQTSNVTATVTLRRKQLTSKTKDFIRSTKLTVNGTIGIGSTSVSGLTVNDYYGLRVEDREISLNLPDVVNVIAIYQSTDTSLPVLDALTFVSGLGLDINTVLGEKIVGSNSRAVAQLVTRSSSTQVEFVYLNNNRFEVGETVTFKESNIESNIQSIRPGSYVDLTNNFTLDKGQKDQYYDYSRIVRSEGGVVPSKKLMVIFNHYQVSSGNSGDIFTVNSYTADRFKKDIPLLDGNTLRASDTIDIRPRVVRFTATNASPFAFSSRSFESNVNYIISPNESSLIGYSHYLPRTDKVTISKFGEVSVIPGSSSTNPQIPLNVDDVMDVAEIYLPPYLYDTRTQPRYRFFDNRRFTMRDIANLESRIKNLEVTTSLSLLELDTKTLQIQDADGLTRFKTGFIADNFQNSSFVDLSDPDNKCDVDIIKKELINAVDNWSMDAELALDPSLDRITANRELNLKLLDGNIQKTGDLLTLKYNEVKWLEQPQASQVENVNPFNVIEFAGAIVIEPASDNWVRTIYVDNHRTESTGATWVEQKNVTRETLDRDSTPDFRETFGRDALRVDREITSYTNVLEGPSREFDYVERIKVSGDVDPYLRSRNVFYFASGLKPQTTHWHSLDNQPVDFCNKLIEIEMVSGTFRVGEYARAHLNGQLIMRFPVPPPNHKTGDWYKPEKIYNVDIYDRTRPAPGTDYSPTSKLLNVGVRACSNGQDPNIGGFITPGSIINGETSGAIARVIKNEHVSDTYGDILGTFFLRDPNASPPPSIRVRTGQRTFIMTAVPPGITPVPGSTAYASKATGVYSGSGTILTQQTSSVSVRNPPPPSTRPPEVRDTVTRETPPERRAGGKDPLAQSFTVDETGAFLTGADVYFASKDPSARLFVELRTVELGLPTNQLVQDYARVALDPSDITTSSDASLPTRITFPSPIYLEANKEYALVFLAPTSDLFEMWVATMGQKTVKTSNLPDVQSVIVTKQYSGGSLFKSQNGTIWTPSQYQDLTFKLYKAEFVTSGTATFYNTDISPGNINCQPLISNPIKTLPRKLKVGISGAGSLTSVLTTGRKVGYGVVGGTSSTGIIEKVGSSISSSSGLSLVTTGSGFNASQTYNNVPLYSIRGNGNGATATVVTGSDGKVSTVTVTAGTRGNGYAVGDVLGITTSNVVKGSGATVSVNAIDSTPDTLYLTNVQGESFVSGQTLIYYAGDSRTTTSASINGSSSLISDLYTGNVIEVSQYNHGMHGLNNQVTIQDIKPDRESTTLTSAFSPTDTTVYVSSTTPFSTFEGIGSTSRGYALIENEIVSYSSIGSGLLQIDLRGVDGSSIIPHPVGAAIQPYEVNGVSLTKINKTHTLPSNRTLIGSGTLDKYYLQIDRGTRSSGENQLSFTDTKTVGGSDVKISQNHQFSSFRPEFNVITPGDGTTVTSQVRTISGTSSGGSESSFIDLGYEPITLNKTTFFNTPRLVASRVNEVARLGTLPLNKSLSLRIDFESGDKNLSPVLDLQTAYFTLSRNRLNKPVSSYVIDDRSNKLSGDPHASVFITKRVDLKQPATSLQVLVGACRPPQADFRVLYRLFKSDSSEVPQSYSLFPGYDNLRDTDGDGYGDLVIDPALNSGNPDAYVRPSGKDEFLEYQFTANDLDPFTGFVIKIVMSSPNESAQVKLKDFRAIALA